MGLVALFVLASGCNSRLIRPPAIVYADSGEYKVSTEGDEGPVGFPAVFTAFTPSTLALHPDDALNFDVRDTGEPHTVALGTMVTQALAAVDALGVTADTAKVEKLPAMRRLPSVFPNASKTKLPALDPAATKRCFLSEGRPVTGEECDEVDQPEFDGKQPFYSSGILEDGEPFRVKLSGDIAPASYRFMCLVQRAAMTGTIEVRPPDVVRPTVAELRQEAEREEASIETSLEPSARAAVRGSKGGPIRAGAGPRGTTRGFIEAFLPEIKAAKVDAGVRWTLYGTHSISFSPSQEASEGLLLLDGDEVRVNPDVWAAVGSRPAPPGVFTYPGLKKKFAVAGGTWDGEGSWSSGVLRASRPAQVSYSMRFSKEGSYAYTCLVHPGMRGKVEVSGG